MKRIFLSIIAISIAAVVSVKAQQPVYTLDQILDAALKNNVAVSTARHNIEKAELQRKEALTKYFPSVSGNLFWFNASDGLGKLNFNLSKYIPASVAEVLAGILTPEEMAMLSRPLSYTLMKDGVVAGVNAIQPIFAGGQIVYGNKLAKVGEDASRLQLSLSENQVTKTAEQYFWQVVTLEEKVKTLDEADRLLADIYKDVKVAIDAGVTLRNDLLQVQLRQNELESQRLQLNNGIKLVRMLLAQYCGLDSTAFRLSYSTDVPSPLTVHSDHASALSATAEYQLLNKQVEAAEIQRKMEIGKNMPTVALGIGYSYNNLLFNDKHTSPMVFATVNVPITDWWSGSSAIKRKQIERQIAEEQLADNSQLLTIRMQKAWNDLEEAYLQISIANRSVEQAKENLRIKRNYYNAGTSTMSDLLEAQLLEQQALNRHIDAIADYHSRLLDYRQATGQ